MIEMIFDAGHGGKDPGAVGYGLNEKDVVLDLCLKTGNYILQNYNGVRIHYTRTSDVFLSLTERTNLANLKRVDFMYSFHNNSLNETSNGFETFSYTNVSAKTIAYQNLIHDEIMSVLKEYGIKDRGKKQKDLHIVRESNMPAVLTEYLFISNKKENDLLRSESFINELAKATGKGIAKAFGLKEKPKPVVKGVVKKMNQDQQLSKGDMERLKLLKDLGITDLKNPLRQVNQQYVWEVVSGLLKAIKEGKVK